MKGITLLFTLLFAAISIAQTTFTNNREKFVKEFQKLMNASTSNNLTPFVKEELAPLLLETSDFSDAYFNRMVTTGNLIIAKKLKAYPEVYNYVYSVYSLVKEKQSEASYNAWHESIDKLLSARNPKKFKGFIQTSKLFFDEGIIHYNKSYQWCYFGGEYKFILKGNAPFIELNNGRMVCRTVNNSRKTVRKIPFTDSIVIHNTSGTFDPLFSKWVGKGGTLNWEKVALPANETYAELNNYLISMKQATFSADSVLMTTPYFSSKVSGKLSDRAQKGSYNAKNRIPFPQFVSYAKRLKIDNIVEDVNYDGGFSMKGANFIGVGSIKAPIQLTFIRNGKPFIRATSQLLNVSSDKLWSYNAKTSVYVGPEDSLFHPGCEVYFYKKDNRVELKRGKTGISQAPFSNTYHQLDMYVEQILWDRSETVLDFAYNFATSQEQRIARFESKNYYDKSVYDALQGMEKQHPLVGLSRFAYKYDEYVINEGKAATALLRTVEQAKPTLLKLSNLGFISYDTEAKMVTINPKTDNFIKARSGKKDYDNMQFVSDLRPKRMDGYSPEQIQKDPELRAQKERMEKINRERSGMKSYGNIDLANLELDLVAVNDITLSTKQNTKIYPGNDEVTIRKNRNLIFNGWVNAGKWEIKIDEGNYNYDDNKINILKSDVALFRILPLREKDGKANIASQSSIKGVKGYILIDNPKNRSGLKDKDEFAGYPKLVSKEKTKVLYNDKSIYRGAYEANRFFFEIDPFELDSLDNFEDLALKFGGELTSAGIFPKFRDSLRVMPDYSLGFRKNAPSGGYDFYGDVAQYDSVIYLSNKGLQGAGQIDFVNSTSVSKRFTFLPDSTLGIASFINKPSENGVQFPDVVSEEAYITYVPRGKVLKAKSMKEPLNFFNNEAKLRGVAVVRPKGMSGSGLMEFSTASITSKNYSFKRWDIDADTSNFNLKNTGREPGDLTEDPLAFKTNNVTAHVSFEERKGEFKSNDGESTVEFPVNKYICKMDMFTWLMDDDAVEMESSEDKDLALETDLDLVGPNFFSIHPKQDSLQFRAPKAKFSLKEKTIYCSKTEFIDVADARIYPDSAKVTIRKNAKMDLLENSTIVANYITKYHNIVNANTKITARRAYTSEGDYQYFDLDSNVYVIRMEDIHLDTSYQTVASGEIALEDDFKLSQQFDFYGKVNMQASTKEMIFNGATKIEHDCNKFAKSWMAFNAPIDPENIQIPVGSNMKDLDGNAISAGIVWRNSNNTDSLQMYPTFLSALEDKEDPIVITASGFLQYEPSAKEYQISSKAKLLNRSEVGNYISLHVPTCGMNGDGVIDLGMEFGDMVVENVGIVNYNQDLGKTTMNLTTKIATPMDKSLTKMIADKVIAEQTLKLADFNSNTLEQAIATWDSQKTADKIKSDYTLKGVIKKFPKKMQETFVFTGVKLESYDKPGDPIKGLRTNANEAILVSIYDEPVMKYLPFKLFAEQRVAVGDKLGFLINLPIDNEMYFYQYQMLKKQGVMNCLTSNAEYRNAMTEIKEDKRKIKKFTYKPSNESVLKINFDRIFQ